MSRSFKKPYVKDGGTGMKRCAARMERRIVKQLLKPWRNNYRPTIERGCWDCECREWDYFEGMEYLPMCDFDKAAPEPLLPLRKQIVNGYDICDWRSYQPNRPEYYRK